jgi:hypothetical protein
MVQKKKLTLLEIKQSLWDQRFRELFPEIKKEIDEFLKNPGCPCNVSLYKEILKQKDRLQKYFPTKDIEEVAEDVKLNNNFKVINCKATQLEKELRKLRPGRKQLAVARWEDEVTVVINELDFNF